MSTENVPRLFMLGGNGVGYEIPLDWYERYQRERFDPAFP